MKNEIILEGFLNNKQKVVEGNKMISFSFMAKAYSKYDENKKKWSNQYLYVPVSVFTEKISEVKDILESKGMVSIKGRLVPNVYESNGVKQYSYKIIASDVDLYVKREEKLELEKHFSVFEDKITPEPELEFGEF